MLIAGPEVLGLLAGLFNVILFGHGGVAAIGRVLILDVVVVAMTAGGTWMAKRQKCKTFFSHSAAVWPWAVGISFVVGILAALFMDLR
jgi:uncharacterized membrane protein YozB (DUF420 family)